MATKNTQTQTKHLPIEQIIKQITTMLDLDSKIVARIYEAIHDDRFIMNTVGEEIIMTVGPVECDSEGYADMALTPAEAIALAVRLLQYATQLLRI